MNYAEIIRAKIKEEVEKFERIGKLMEKEDLNSYAKNHNEKLDRLKKNLAFAETKPELCKQYLPLSSLLI